MDAPDPCPFAEGTASGMRLKKKTHIAEKNVCYIQCVRTLEGHLGFI
jgi:hypothetical protein